ncbi:MAG: hypothetical protein LH468_10100 [Nocardioides sp.]|nr:hypothetical protein [Nocardioides sp.]
MSRRTEATRAYAVAAVVIGFFVLGLLAMLITGVLSGGQPETSAPTGSSTSLTLVQQ